MKTIENVGADSGMKRAGPTDLDRLRNAENRLISLRSEIRDLDRRLREFADGMGVRSRSGGEVRAHPPQSVARMDAPVMGTAAETINIEE